LEKIAAITPTLKPSSSPPPSIPRAGNTKISEDLEGREKSNEDKHKAFVKGEERDKDEGRGEGRKGKIRRGEL
jgi:hypothetical protein